MKTTAAIEYFDGRQGLASALTRDGWRVTPEAISQWGEEPPRGRQYQIQALTNGVLKANSQTK